MPLNLDQITLQSWSLRQITDVYQMAECIRDLGLKAAEFLASTSSLPLLDTAWMLDAGGIR